MMMPDLLPCPFCGMDFVVFKTQLGLWAASHETTAQCPIEFGSFGELSNLVQALNTRATAADYYHKGYQQGLIDAHKDAVETIDDHLEDEP